MWPKSVCIYSGTANDTTNSGRNGGGATKPLYESHSHKMLLLQDFLLEMLNNLKPIDKKRQPPALPANDAQQNQTFNRLD